MASFEKSGIYLVSCLPTGEGYVGSTTRIYRRWYLLRKALRAGVCRVGPLQRAWNKHGEAAFVFEVAAECAREDLAAREQHYIDLWKPEFNTLLQTGISQVRGK